MRSQSCAEQSRPSSQTIIHSKIDKEMLEYPNTMAMRIESRATHITQNKKTPLQKHDKPKKKISVYNDLFKTTYFNAKQANPKRKSHAVSNTHKKKQDKKQTATMNTLVSETPEPKVTKNRDQVLIDPNLLLNP